MEDFSLDSLVEICRNDPECKVAILEWDADIAALYARGLPAFESFIFNLPKTITMKQLSKKYIEQPLPVRLIFALRLHQFQERLQSAEEVPVYKNLWDILMTECYLNHPDKINYQ
jgi:hypothetical protein